MVKKYRLKDECKKYFDKDVYFINNESTLEHWKNIGISLEALEEVEENVTLIICYIYNQDNLPTSCLRKSNRSEWSLQELHDIESLLNRFGSFEKLNNIIDEYGYSCYTNTNTYSDFPTWLKEKGYE